MPSSNTGKQAQQIERLLKVSRILGAAVELDAMYDAVVDAACDLTGSEKGALLLIEAETNLLKYVAGRTSDKVTLKRVRVPLENSLAGRVYTQAKPLVVHSIRPDSPVVQEVGRAVNLLVTSILAAPLIFRGETIGIIEVFNRRDPSHYTQEDVTILETLAAQASVSILSIQMVDETRRAYEELEELERMKRDFIAIASHELRTPLGLILGHSTDLLDTTREAEARHQLDVIVRNANRLKKIIEDLSNVNAVHTRNNRMPRRLVDLGSLVRHVVNGFQERARSRQIILRTELPRVELAVDGDEEKLSVVLSNLIENALTYTDRNGQVVVSGEKLPGYIKVSVIDNGIGIPAKDLARVFDKFYQVESHLTRRHAGMGLGLSVAKVMIEMHDGQIWVESVVGKGSNFSFLLPSRNDREKTHPLGLKTPVLSKPFE